MIKNIFKIINLLPFSLTTLIRGLYHIPSKYIFFKRNFGHLGNNILLIPPISFGNPKNVFLYDDIFIAAGTSISTTNAKFIMKSHSVAATGLTVRTGNHMMKVGRFFKSICDLEKDPSYDRDIIVNEDVWIGCNVTLLSGITIGRGAIIAAGAVVNKDIPPYAVAGGVPAKVIKFKWTVEEILKHETLLYPPEDRLSEEYLYESRNL